MHGNDLPNILSGITVALTLAVIWFAWRTVKEAQKATAEEQRTVTKLQEIVVAVTDLVSSSGRSAELAKAAGDRELWRQIIAQLRSMLETVEGIRVTAAGEITELYNNGASDDDVKSITDWVCPGQDDLAATLGGVPLKLPDCLALAHTKILRDVHIACLPAEMELEEALRDLGVSPPKKT